MLAVIGFLIHLSLTPAVASFSPAGLFHQVPFFKTAQSPFPSGFENVGSLQRQQLQKTLVAETAYRYNGVSFRRDEIKPVLPVHLSQYVIDIATQQRWKVIETGIENLKVENAKTKSVIQMSTADVLSDSFDRGSALTLKDTFLRSEATEGAKVLTTIAQGFRLTPQEFKNGFFRVKYKDYIGYVSLSESLTKFDFCSMVYTKGQWSIVKKREFDQLVTSDGLKISMNAVEKMLTPDTRGIIASNSQKIPMWSQVEVVKGHRADWIQSFLKGHGPVWWKLPESEDGRSEASALLIDQLIRQPISSVSFHPKNPLKGILSSRGVFLTEDGLHWRQLKQFEDFNGPVHYFNDLLIFVGNFSSVDGGKTFENYIQIDKLAQAIEDQYGFLPKRLQVSRIETKAPFRIKIEIETGYRKIKMESPLFAQEWKAVKI